MKNISQVLLCGLLLALVGCGRNSTSEIPSTTSADIVSNQSGIGTAQIFGIDFRVNATSNGASGEHVYFKSSKPNSSEPDNLISRKRFTFGDDIAIQLDRISESNVQFMFNDQDFDDLNVGDKVVIDDERNVEVNGTPRLPRTSN